MNKFVVVSPHLHVPTKSAIESQVIDFYMRMRQHLRPHAHWQSIPRTRRDKVLSVAQKIHSRREAAAGLRVLHDHHRVWIDRLALEAGQIKGPMTEHAVDEWAGAVHALTPWLGALTALLMKYMRKQVRAGKVGLSMPPLLLVGEPGNGKSWYAEMIGRIAGAPVREIDVGGGSAGFRISGLEKGWSGSNPGIPVEMMLAHRVANPVIVVNEICKTGDRVKSTSGSVSSLTTSLLQVLEPETASRFECPSFRIRFDLSRINWILTANNIGTVPPPLRDRCLVFQMPPMTPDIAGLMFDTLARAVRTEFDPDLFEIAKTRVVAAAVQRHVSLRQIRRVLDAISADRPEMIH